MPRQPENRMANKIKSLSLEMQRVIDLGLIDSWLRGLSEIIPRPRHGTKTDDNAYNTHMIYFDSAELIGDSDISKLTGMGQLLTGCTQQDVGVSVKLEDERHLRVEFKPELPFASTTVFETAYGNVVPASFKRK